ncbi:hypothetical protein CICLE_v10029752mg [Citrus x clementina]|uniref:Uncharacterized protein n=1 Tax=Citrus clementina TaxID=85681 RepID=V4SFZ2_CITCL|nr:hypothetical protein CICLE_v10029752mg [Citrus x clementina]
MTITKLISRLQSFSSYIHNTNMSTHPLTHTLLGAVTSDFRLLQKFSIKRAHDSTNSEDNQIGYWILVIN